MLKTTLLEHLTIAELLFLQNHIRLGKGHLETCLSKQEIDAICKYGTVEKRTSKELGATKMEMASFASLGINTVLTGLLGGWLGGRAFLELEVASTPWFNVIIASCVLVGIYIGIEAIRLRKKIANDAIEKRKLQDLEHAIYKEINKKKHEALQLAKEGLVSILKKLKLTVKSREIEDKNVDLHQLCLEWTAQLQEICPGGPKESTTTKYVASEISKTQRLLLQEHKSEDDPETCTFKIIADKLSHASMEPDVNLKAWIRKNFNRLLVEFIPTMLGGAASLFVYLGGAPAIAKEMGKQSIFDFLTQPEMKIVQLLLSLGITLYFAFSFLCLNIRGFKRDKEFSKAQIKLTKEENATTELDGQILKINEMFRIMNPLYCKLHFILKGEGR